MATTQKVVDALAEKTPGFDDTWYRVLKEWTADFGDFGLPLMPRDAAAAGWIYASAVGRILAKGGSSPAGWIS
ncbi:hypothetical protein GMDG_04616 [Pseudogymnoascus destructans 20631-21]|uniref:Uncharacterized protein n=1 Tax=Pseudogymnoascus destructans (strain ATCC MYA-4855 / 20631-21) TaxID=658429 RepID=L8GAX9_PSED2|nr:hypothetical protein GMDG_04616 [Pseudogymnoascus destructans 20631-21]